MKTHPIELDKRREIRFPSKYLRQLDMELSERHGHGFLYFAQELTPERFKAGTADMRFDVLVSALKYGLMHADRTVRDDNVCDMLDAAEATEMNIWSVVTDAYMDARGMRLEVDEPEQEVAYDPPAPSRQTATAS